MKSNDEHAEREELRPDPLFNLKRFRRFAGSNTRRAPLQLWPIPLWQRLRNYKPGTLRSDVRAGVNVALLDFPQGMAYALIAGLPFYMGIYASAVGAILGPILASSRFIMVGPSNAIAALTLSAFLSLGMDMPEKVAAMPLLLIMVGVFMIIGSILRVAGVINYISRSVITGYVTAAAFLIIANQIKNVLGIDVEQSATFFGVVAGTVQHLPETHMPSLSLGIITVSTYLALKFLTPRLPAVALTLIAMYFVAKLMAMEGYAVHPLSTEPMAVGQWPITMPNFSFEMVSRLSTAALAIAFLSLLESSSIAKILAARAGDTVNVNQQMMSLGTASIGGAFLSGMPVSGSLTRSMLNYASGAKSPVSSMISGTLLAAGVMLLAPYIADIPMPALGVLVITIGVTLLNWRNIRMVMGSTNNDMVVFIATFIGGLLFPLDTAIYLGVVVSVILFVKQAGAPQMVEYSFTEQGKEVTAERSTRPGLALLHVEGDLFFGSADIFLDQAKRIVEDPNLGFIILRLRNAHNLDATCCMAIEQLARMARENGGDVLISGAHPEVYAVFRNSGLLQTLGADHVFQDDPHNPNLSTSRALKRAQQLAGEKSLEVRLFVSERKKKEKEEEEG